MIRAFFLLACLLVTPAHAVSDPAEMLADPAQEARARDLGHQLRCLVCQNNSIEESEAEFARDMRRVIRVRVAAGDSDDAVIAWTVARYGEFVRLRPAFSGITLLLWASPLLALLIGFAAVILARRRAAPPPAKLSDDEAATVRRLSNP